MLAFFLGKERRGHSSIVALHLTYGIHKVRQHRIMETPQKNNFHHLLRAATSLTVVSREL